MSSHQQPFQLTEMHPLPVGPSGVDALPGVTALHQAIAFAAPPATPGKGSKGRKRAGGEDEDSYVPSGEEEEDGDDEEDDDDDSAANNQQSEFVLEKDGQLRRRRKKLTKKWTQEEDLILVQLVTMHGQRDWGLIARHMPGKLRKGKQCRERWRNQVGGSVGWVGGLGVGGRGLIGETTWVWMDGDTDDDVPSIYVCVCGKQLDPAIKRDAWTPEEEVILQQAHATLGNKYVFVCHCVSACVCVCVRACVRSANPFSSRLPPLVCLRR